MTQQLATLEPSGLLIPQGVKNAWDIWPGEDAKWFARFEAFRLIPAQERTLQRAYANERILRNPKLTYRNIFACPKSWKEARTVWQWDERALASDRAAIDAERARLAAMEAARLARIEQEAEQARAARRDMLRSATGLYITVLTQLQEAIKNKKQAPDLAELTSFAKMLLQESRAEYNQLPTNKLDIDFGNKTNEQLLEYIQEQLNVAGFSD